MSHACRTDDQAGWLARFGTVALALATVLVLHGVPVPPAAAQSAEAGSGEITGFRSAKFGMDIEDVLDAIEDDFDKSGDAIARGTNPTEKTPSLVVLVEDLLPDTGTAQVVYSFGYRSEELQMVVITWGGVIDREVAAAELVSAANVLRSYFLELGLPREGMIVNQPLPNGSVIAFRGQDAAGRIAQLRLVNQPDPAAGQPAEGEAPPQRLSLQLVYSLGPEALDVFRIEKGAF